MAVLRASVSSDRGAQLRASLFLNLAHIFALILVLTVGLPAQESEDSSATDAEQDVADNASADRINSLEQSLGEVEAQLQLTADSLVALRDSQEVATAAAEIQSAQFLKVSDSLAARQAVLEEQLQAATDSLTAMTSRSDAGAADNQTLSTRITQLQDSLGATILSQTALKSRFDSLTALKAATDTKLTSASDSLSMIGILYNNAASSNRVQIVKISGLRDSLARSISEGRAQQVRSDSILALKDTLVMNLGQVEGVVATQVASMGSLRGEVRLRDSLLAVVRDSLSRSVGREANLQARHDSLTALKISLAADLDQAGKDLATAASTEQSLRTEIKVLEVAFQVFENRLASGEPELASIYDQVKTAVIAVQEESLDEALDDQYLAHLVSLVGYKAKSRGLGRLRGGESKQQTRYKMEEFRQYLAWAELRGNTPEALNLLAATYAGQKDDMRAALTYLKTMFIYPNSPAADSASASLAKSLKKGDEVARLYQAVALNPDSMRVGDQHVYRYFHFLEHVHRLQHEVARSYFLDEANQFLAFYPDVYNVDLLYSWTADTYHDMGEYNTEVLIYLKVRNIFAGSHRRAQFTYSLAEVTATDLKDFQLGAERYALFLEEFYDHALAPQSLLSQAKLYEMELKQPEKAGELYSYLARSYADDELAPEALFGHANLLQGKLKSAPEALMVYQEILSKYGEDEGVGVRALEALAGLSKKSRQYDAAVVYYLEIFTRFPGAVDQVVNGLMDAADIYDGRLKNPGGALQTLQLVISNYPQHSKIKAVQKKVLKLEKEIG